MWIPFTFGYISLHLSFIGTFTFSSSHVYFTGSLCLTDLRHRSHGFVYSQTSCQTSVKLSKSRTDIAFSQVRPIIILAPDFY